MLKKNTLASLIFIFFLTFFSVAVSWGGFSPAISITGSVRQPLNLTLEDLHALEAVTVRLNEVTMAEEYNGVF